MLYIKVSGKFRITTFWKKKQDFGLPWGAGSPQSLNWKSPNTVKWSRFWPAAKYFYYYFIIMARKLKCHSVLFCQPFWQDVKKKYRRHLLSSHLAANEFSYLFCKSCFDKSSESFSGYTFQVNNKVLCHGWIRYIVFFFDIIQGCLLIVGSDRNPRCYDVVCAFVSDIMLKRTLK